MGRRAGPGAPPPPADQACRGLLKTTYRVAPAARAPRVRGLRPATAVITRPHRAVRASVRAVDVQLPVRDGRTPQPSEPPPEQSVPKRPVRAGRASGRSRLPNSVLASARRLPRLRREGPILRVRRPTQGTPRQSGTASTAWLARRRWRLEQPAHGASAQSLPRDRPVG